MTPEELATIPASRTITVRVYNDPQKDGLNYVLLSGVEVETPDAVYGGCTRNDIESYHLICHTLRKAMLPPPPMPEAKKLILPGQPG